MDSIYPPVGPMPPEGPKVVPAATMIIFRKGPAPDTPEILMVRRASKMRFAAGAAVFPGGRVDPSDRALAERLAPDADHEVTSAKIAGIRETLEETGLMIATRQPVTAHQAAQARVMLLEREDLAPVIDRFEWELDLESMAYFAHWCPPMDNAFDTRFFVTDLGTGAVDIKVDATENTHLFWTTAQGALDMHEKGDIHVIFPTMRNLERLAGLTSFEDARESAAAFPPRRMSARRETIDGEEWVTIPDGRGYPVLGQPLKLARRG